MLSIAICDTDIKALGSLYETITNALHGRQSMAVKFAFYMDLIDYITSTDGTVDVCVVRVYTGTDESFLTIQRISESFPLIKIIIIAEQEFCENRLDKLFSLHLYGFIYSQSSKETLVTQLTSAFLGFENASSNYLSLVNNGKNYKICISSINYIESDKRKIIIHEDDGTVSEFYMKLDEAEELVGQAFLRCHQSFLVNMDKIKGFLLDGLELYSKDVIPIVRRRFYSCRKEYMSYITGSAIVPGDK